MKCAIVGCGYVADLYAATRHAHPQLTWVGAWDRDPQRLDICSRKWGVRAYTGLDQICDDSSVDLVLNLTNPRSHFDITKQCLEAGKHVYSEKPLAMTAADAATLAELARRHGRQLSAAPCSLLSPPAQTLWHALRSNAIGRVRLVYANFDDGMIAPFQQPWQWRNDAGVPWPAKDEFEVGCTYQHAGYVLTWLAAFFGSARRVTAFASCLLPDKGTPVETMAPDFTLGAIEYDHGVVARVTCGLVAPRDKSMTVIGDEGLLAVTSVRDEHAPIMISRRGERRSLAERIFAPLTRAMSAPASLPFPDRVWRTYPRTGPAPGPLVGPEKPVDFLRGPADMAAAIATGRAGGLPPELGIHVVEIVERLQYPERFASPVLSTTCPALQPL